MQSRLLMQVGHQRVTTHRYPLGIDGRRQHHDDRLVLATQGSILEERPDGKPRQSEYKDDKVERCVAHGCVRRFVGGRFFVVLRLISAMQLALRYGA